MRIFRKNRQARIGCHAQAFKQETDNDCWNDYLPSRSCVRPNDLHHANQQMTDFKMAWSIFDIFTGY